MRPSFTTLAIVFFVFMPPLASAIGPPVSLARESIASARKTAVHTMQIRAHAVQGEGVFSGRARFATNENLVLQNAERKIVVDVSSKQPWRALWLILCADDPLGLPEFRSIDETQTRIEVHEKFSYVFGQDNAVTLSQDLSRIERVKLRAEGHSWIAQVHWSRTRDAIDRILLIRDGSTIWRVDIEDSSDIQAPREQSQNQRDMQDRKNVSE